MTDAGSKAELVLEVLKGLLETVPDAVVERNSVLPEKVPDGVLIMLRDGDPGEPEQALGGFGNAYYEHAVETRAAIKAAALTVTSDVTCEPASKLAVVE